MAASHAFPLSFPTIAVAAMGLAALGSPAAAALGGDAASVTADRIRMKAVLRADEHPGVQAHLPPAGAPADDTRVGTDGARRTLGFTAGNAQRLLALDTTSWAIPGLSPEGSHPQVFDRGLPLHFGRSVFVAIEGPPTPVGPGPWVAH